MARRTQRASRIAQAGLHHPCDATARDHSCFITTSTSVRGQVPKSHVLIAQIPCSYKHVDWTLLIERKLAHSFVLSYDSRAARESIREDILLQNVRFFLDLLFFFLYATLKPKLITIFAKSDFVVPRNEFALSSVRHQAYRALQGRVMPTLDSLIKSCAACNKLGKKGSQHDPKHLIRL